jgi:hypothetical protein
MKASVSQINFLVFGGLLPLFRNHAQGRFLSGIPIGLRYRVLEAQNAKLLLCVEYMPQVIDNE